MGERRAYVERETLAEHFDDVIAFGVWRPEALCPPDERAVVDAVLSAN